VLVTMVIMVVMVVVMMIVTMMPLTKEAKPHANDGGEASIGH